MLAESIDDVISRLDQQIERYRAESSRMGYFPALYRKVTLAVKEDIARERFEDGARMERLDVLFANRYLEALDQWQRNREPTAAWRVAFTAADRWPPIVLQHLLLGINAHINLDLGIAAAQTAPGTALPALQQDFDRINDILFAQVAGVKDELTQVWPLLRIYAALAGSLEDGLIRFSLSRARNAAWQVATELAALDPAAQRAAIPAIDRRTALLGRVIAHPPLRTRLVLLGVRLGERGSVPQIIDLLL